METATQPGQQQVKPIRSMDDIYRLQEGDAILISVNLSSLGRTIGARVLRPAYSLRNQERIDLRFRIDVETIVDAEVVLKEGGEVKSRVIPSEGSLDAEIYSYSTSSRVMYGRFSTVFDADNASLREVGF